MAAHKPLVIIDGQTQRMPDGDTLAVASSEVDVISMTNANAGSLVIGAPVYVSSASNVNKAAASASGTSKVLGVVKDVSISAAAVGLIQTDGVIAATTEQWDAVTGATGGLTAGSLYFLSATAGQLTTTAPNTAGHYIMRVGLALSTTELEIDTDRGGVLL